MNRRRQAGGAEDVPNWFWTDDAVQNMLQDVVGCALSEGFEGDWDMAPLPLEEKMDALASALRQLSRQVSLRTHRGAVSGKASRFPGDEENLIFRHRKREDQEGSTRHDTLPEVVRYDAGGRALADYLTWRWQNHGYTAYFRRRFCGGIFLSREDAWEFLTSPLSSVLSIEDYSQLGTSPAEARGRILSKYWVREDGLLFFANLRMGDPEQPITPLYTWHHAGGKPSSTVQYCVEIEQPHRARLVLNRCDSHYHYVAECDLLPSVCCIQQGFDRDWHMDAAPPPFFPEERRSVEGCATSAIAELISSAQMLCAEYNVSIWDMLEALLTGRFPAQPSVEIFPSEIQVMSDDGPDECFTGKVHTGFTAQGPATLTVQPWVTPEVLADAWREHRKNNPCYSPTEMQAGVLHFVLSHTPPGEAFGWERLAKQWQQERGETIGRGQLKKQFDRAQAAILPGFCATVRRY